MKRLIYVIILMLLLTACGTASEPEQTEPLINEVESVAEVAETAATTAPSTDIPLPTPTLAPTDVPLTDVPPTDVPPTDVPPTDVPPTDVPPTDVPPTDVPPTDVPPTDVPPTDVPPTDVPPTDVPPTDVPPTDVPPAVNSSLPAWQTSPMVDVKTGQTFTLADYAGETVFVEPMATWCTNCRNQLGQVSTAMNTVGWGTARIVVLSIETNFSQSELAAYAEDTQFPFQFAVMTPDVLHSMVTEFGRTITAPPSTPHFIIRPNGTTTTLQTGFESADEIAAEIQAAQ